MAKPTSITGGCLCEGVRYKITFPDGHDFYEGCSTCQCSQCRKQTGSLIFRVQKVPVSALEYTSQATLAKYHASEGNARGFCNACGSFLFWQNEKSGRISMCVGCFDKDALQQYGPVLTTAKMHLFAEAEIPGVTDHLKGERYKYDNDVGEVVRLPDRS